MKQTHISIDSKFVKTSSDIPSSTPFVKNKKKSTADEIIQVAKYSSISYYFVIPILLGLFVGFELDKKFDSKPLFVLSGIFVGSISAFFNMKRLLSDPYFKLKEKDQDKKR